MDSEDAASTRDEITRRLNARLRDREEVAVLDVGERYEWAVARLPEARLIPLRSLPRAVHALDRAREIVVDCHHGMRSEAAAEWLRALNPVGGIDRWNFEVDPSARRY